VVYVKIKWDCIQIKRSVLIYVGIVSLGKIMRSSVTTEILSLEMVVQVFVPLRRDLVVVKINYKSQFASS
jgi:hypothetical protein